MQRSCELSNNSYLQIELQFDSLMVDVEVSSKHRSFYGSATPYDFYRIQFPARLRTSVTLKWQFGGFAAPRNQLQPHIKGHRGYKSAWTPTASGTDDNFIPSG